MKLFFFLIATPLLFSSCGPFDSESFLSPVSTQVPLSTTTEISETAIIATEQMRVATVKAEFALTRAAQPTFTSQPTLTSTVAGLPTLTPMANSTPGANGAYFDVASNVLGPKYEIENACYFDTQSGWKRHEIYAGALAGSGDEYSAQGVVIIRVFQIGERDGQAHVELVDNREYLTQIKAGPLRIPSGDECGKDWILLTTALNFGWFLNLRSEEFYQYDGIVPLARLEGSGKTQFAELGSYCWKTGCADGPVIPTSSEPLVIQTSSVTHLRLPLDEPSDQLSLSAMLVSPPGALQGDATYDYIGKDKASWSYDKPGREPFDLGALRLQPEQEIKFSLEPGYYAVTILAIWRNYGDVKYGFLIEVQG